MSDTIVSLFGALRGDTTTTNQKRPLHDDDVNEREREKGREKISKKGPKVVSSSSKVVTEQPKGVVDLPASDDYIFEATTCSPGPIEKAFGVLNMLLDEMTLKINTDGIVIEFQESSHVGMTQMTLKAASFDRFFCAQPIDVSVSVDNFCDFIQGARNANAILTIGVLRNNPNKSLRIEVFDMKNGSHESNDLPTFHHDSNGGVDICKFSISPLKSNVVVMDSSDLKDIIKKLSGSKGEDITIGISSDKITFSSSGEAGTKSDTRKPSGPVRLKYVKDVSYRYPMRFMKGFSKAFSVNEKVNIYIGPDQPLMLCYRIWTFGELWFALANRNVTNSCSI